MSRPHIVIVGAGFGGMYAAKRLVPYVQNETIDVTIVNRTNYFLFTPLLHEVATGALSPNDVAEPLREIFHGTGVKILQGEVTGIDTTKNTLRVADSEISYSHLILATGSDTNYYNIPGAADHTLPLKNLHDASMIRDGVINAFERATLAHSAQEKSEALSFVIVGGGASGVETAAEIAEFISEIEHRYYRKCRRTLQAGMTTPEDITITLVSTTSLLKQFHPSIQKAAEERLKHNGVKLKLGVGVTAVEKNRLVLADGTSIPAGMIIWTAGVKPYLPPLAGPVSIHASGKLITDNKLLVKGTTNVFALGDSAMIESDPMIPMLAQVAVGQADTVAYNVLATIENRSTLPYSFKSKGSLVSLGQWFAAGEVYTIRIYGPIAWWMWRTIYLFKFHSFKKQVRIVIDWTLNAFYPRDITKLL